MKELKKRKWYKYSELSESEIAKLESEIPVVDKPVICPECNANMPITANYCGKCGTELKEKN